MKPNSYEDGQSVQALDQNAAILARQGYGVISGCSVTILNGTLGSSNAAIEVQPGSVFADGTDVSISQTPLDVASSDSDEPRKDLVIYNTTSDSLEVLTGTPETAEPAGAIRQGAEKPNPPALSSSVDALSGGGEPSIPLAELWIPAGAESIESADIGDRRHATDRTFDTISLDALTGDITGDQTLSTVAGDNLDIQSGQLNATDTDTDTDTHVSITDDGAAVASDVGTIDAGTNLTATGDSTTVTLDAADGGSGGTKTTLFLSDFTTPGDGSADDTGFDNAVSSASPGDTIVFDGGDYLFNSSHTVSKSLTIRSDGSRLEYTNTTNNNAAILFQGPGIQGTTTTDAAADIGDRTISVTSTTPFSAGDVVLVISDTYASNVNAEIHYARIESVDGTNSNISIYGGLGVEFASGAEVNQIDLLDSPRIVDLETFGGGNRHLQFRWCESPVFDGVEVSEYLEVSLYCLDCWKPRYRDVLATDPTGLASGEGEPIAIYRCTDAFVESARVYDCRRGIDFAWGTRQVTVIDPVIRGVDLNGISVHQNDFSGHVSIKGGEIVCRPDAASGRGISMSDTAEFEIDGTRIIFRDAGVLCTGAAKITDCTLEPAPANTSGQSVGIHVKHSDTYIDNCKILDPNDAFEFGIWVNPSSSGSAVENVDINATIKSTGGNHIVIDARNAAVSDVSIRGFLDGLGGTADQGIFVRSDGGNTMANIDLSVNMESFSSQGIRIFTGSGGGTIESINCHDCFIDASLAAIFSDGSGTFDAIQVVNGEFDTGGTSLSFNESGINKLIIANNIVSGSIDSSGSTNKYVEGNV